MVEMVRRPETVLFLSGQAIFTTSAHTAAKADSYNLPDAEVILAARTESDDASHALVPTNVWQLDVGDRMAIWAGCGALLGVKIWKRILLSRPPVCRTR